MILFPPSATTVRVASVTAAPEGSERNYLAMATDESNENLRNNEGPVLAVQETLLELSQREARAGAKIVFWSEANAVVHAEHEEALIERGKGLARDEQIYLLMSLYTVYPGLHPPENKTVTIDPLHTWVSAVRAVENGFSLVRQTNDGLSAAVDYQGRVLARIDHFTSEEPVMVSAVPIEGVTTVYSRIGDAFAWVCVAGFVWFLGSVLARKSE